jgi:phospholipid transport system substrate-binding protein
MLGSYWATGTLVQRQEFMKLFNSLFARIAFPKIRENFKNLATLTYDNPVINGNEATINSVATINHPIKTQEMKLKYTMSRQQKWKVVDVAVMGASMLADLRDAQIQPLLKQGGWDKLLKAMRDKEAEMNKLR